MRHCAWFTQVFLERKFYPFMSTFNICEGEDSNLDTGESM